jgi:hypothetical protein
MVYFISTFGAHSDADMMANYLKNQGSDEKYK